MTVYVDNMQASFRRMKMCHMIADTHEELVAMADKIGVQRKWIQKPGTPSEHFDICLSKRALAVQHGAVEVTMLELGKKIREKIRHAKGLDNLQKKQARNLPSS